MLSKISDKNGSLYTLEKLLQDDKFIDAQLNQTQESNEFWEDMLEKKAVKQSDYDMACSFIRSVNVEQEVINDDELYSIWENIEIDNKKNLRIRKMRSKILIYLSGMVAFLAVSLLLTNITGITSLKKHTVALQQLDVPWGKRLMIPLPDGSFVWANAGTQIIYPATFDVKTREIYVDGEIYIEVVPEKERPFIVKTKQFNVEVLGTAFNMMAYEKDAIKNIVLISGSIKVREGNSKETILSPNEMFSYTNGISNVSKVDVEDHISWKSGVYQYSSEYLGEILKKLSHYYGCTIECSPQAEAFKFSGKLDLKDKLETILEGITKTSPVKYTYSNGIYKITNR